MWTNRLGILLLAGLLAAAPATSPRAQVPSDAIEFAKTLHSAATRGCGTSGAGTDAGNSNRASGEGPPPGDGRVFANTYFEPTLAKAYIRALDGNLLDFDVFVDGQDCDLGTATIAPAPGVREPVTVRLEFANFNEPRTLDYVLHLSAAGWKLYDIVYRHRRFSLRKLVRAGP